MLNHPPYIAPYAVIFTDPLTGKTLFNQVWDGGGFHRVKKIPHGMKVISGNNDSGYRDIRPHDQG